MGGSDVLRPGSTLLASRLGQGWPKAIASNRRTIIAASIILRGVVLSRGESIKMHTIVSGLLGLLPSGFPRHIVWDIRLAEQPYHCVGVEFCRHVQVSTRYDAQQEGDISRHDKRGSVSLPLWDSLGLLHPLLLIEAPTRGTFKRRFATRKFPWAVELALEVFGREWPFWRVGLLYVLWARAVLLSVLGPRAVCDRGRVLDRR